MCTYRRALKDGAKIQGWQKSNSGIVGLWGDKRGYGRIKGDMGWELRCGEMAKTGERRRKSQFRYKNKRINEDEAVKKQKSRIRQIQIQLI